MPQELSYRARFNLALGAGILLLVALGVGSYTTIQQLRENDRAERAVQEALERLEDTAFQLKTAESLQRKYLITGDRTDLELYRRAHLEVRVALGRARSTPGIADEQRLIPDLELAIERRLDSMDQIAALQQSGLPAAIGLLNSDAARVLRETVDSLVERIREAESRTLQRVRAQTDASARAIQQLMLAGGLLSMLLLVAAAVLVNHYERRRRLAEARLSESTAMMRAVTDIMDEAVITTTAEGRIASVNAAGLRLFGYMLPELMGEPVSRLVPQRHRARLEETLASMRKAPDGIRAAGTRVRGLRSNAEELALQMSFGDARIDGQRFFIAVLFDLTELLRVDRLKSEFVSTVSHELRTPLTSIRGSLGLLAGGVAGPLPDKAAALLTLAKENCERLVRLVNDILDIEKIEAGSMRLELRPAELGPLLRQAVQANEGYAAQHQVTLALELPADPLVARVDSDRFNQVVANLVSNAVKFSPAGAAVTLRLLRGDGQARIEVSDQGPGIPEEFRARMFQKFSQADASDARQKGGTGLGLNIAKAIVERLGGRIGFESVAGRGTTFFFELPQWQP